MSDQFQQIQDEYGQKMVDVSAEILTDDARAMIANGEALAWVDAENSPVIAVRPLKETTIKKWKVGYSNPSLPRFRTGELLQSIHTDYGSLTDTVVAGAEYASEQHYGQSSNGVHNPIARPFFGISDRALKAATAECEKLKERLIAALNTDNSTIQTNLTVSV